MTIGVFHRKKVLSLLQTWKPYSISMKCHAIQSFLWYARTKSQGDSREPLPIRSGDNQKIDSEYIREGTCSISIFTEPLRGWHHSSVRKTWTALVWAEEIKYLLTECYPNHSNNLIMDNLNTRVIASLCKKYPGQEARSNAKR